jgi:hypothetical protein
LRLAENARRRVLPTVAAIEHPAPATVEAVQEQDRLVDRSALIAQRDLILTVSDRIAKLVDQGKTFDEVIAAKPTADLDAQTPQMKPVQAERFIK